MRSHTKIVQNRDGSFSRVITLGVPRDHPFADPDAPVGDGNLHNVRIGPIRLPAPPTFVVRFRPTVGGMTREEEREEFADIRNRANIRENQRVVHIDAPQGGDEEAQVEGLNQQIGRITGAINHLIGTFQRLFTGMEFLRMNLAVDSVSPSVFMTNFNSQVSPDEAMLEMVRRISLIEHERHQKNNAACPEAVKNLAIVEIEEKHCKKLNTTSWKKFEPPTCTVCVELINLTQKGMFMPCGHVFHPDCLRPWLEKNNTCPICRFELKKLDPK
jgi:hypothetical protein